MSFSVQSSGLGLEWSGSDLDSVFAQRRNLLRPRFWGMLADILRFNRLATAIALRGDDAALTMSVGEFLDEHRFGRLFRDAYFLPMIGSIWSCPMAQMLAFPVSTLIRFCHNHGLLQVNDRPRWFTVTGGSRVYVQRWLAALPDARLSCAVRAVRRQPPGPDGGQAGVWVDTDAGSRRNIAAHYDLGNPFYRLWLDETMNYSSAWFDGRPDRPLAEAQRAKMARAIDACALRPGERLLEIGCGWGAVAEMAAGARSLAVTGVTLSTELLAFARERLSRQGLAADLRLQDYRDIPETGFDGIVSIEMFDAVGREYWPAYFRAVRDKLKPGGRRRAGGDRRVRLRPRLCRDAAPLAPGFPRPWRAGAGAGLRRSLDAAVGVLPCLLRGGFRRRQHERRAVHAAPALSRPGPCAAATCSPPWPPPFSHR
jgi:hypothetical protein